MKPPPATRRAPSASVRPASTNRPAEVRIIGGQWKRTKLPVADRPGLRPTPNRVRETVFNWLGQDLTGWRCVDAFAGTGALGLEAASRGAAQVTLVERDVGLCRVLEGVCRRLGADQVRVICADALATLRSMGPAASDLVFLDPPFGSDVFSTALDAAARALRPGGWVYLEAPTEWGATEHPLAGWTRVKHLRAGMVHAHLLQRA